MKLNNRKNVTGYKIIDKRKLTIRETPPIACAVARNPSEILSVMARDTNDVSVASLLINSPDFSLSKKATS